jgi:hypothetical protein
LVGPVCDVVVVDDEEVVEELVDVVELVEVVGPLPVPDTKPK